ncbi:MAG: protein kinase domain-containing protein [Pyrinomonadaceae bacterium]
MLAVNTVLQERYRIIRLLGQGGMGAVYEAIDERFGEPIALKEILIELANSANEKQKDSIIKAFERESKSLAKARHEVVPYVRDYFTELDRQFLVMEMVEGDELADLLEKRKSPFPLEDALKWLDQLLDALDYLHTLKPPIIHRDIKPQNLKLNLRRKIKLLDFGIAKSADTTSSLTNHTFVGATLNYSPIEQILRVIDPTFREFIILKHKEEAEKVLNQSTDARCDIYSLGATFYHLLTNHLPVNVVKRTVEVWSGKADPLINPAELNREIPASIADCLLKAMEVERDNRFSSALEMREVLQTAIAEERRNKQTGNIAAIAEQRRLRIEQEERKLQEQRLMQVKTERLIAGDEIKVETQNEVSSDTKTSPSEVSNSQPLNTQPSVSEPSFTESLPIDVSNTQPSGSVSKAELTGTAYFNKVLIEKKQTIPEPLLVANTEYNSKSNAKPFWILPIAALSILTVGGIGGFVLMNNSGSTNSNKPAANVVISSPTITPTVAPRTSPTPLPVQDKPDKINEKPKPSVIPTPNRTPLQNPVKTPLTRQKTPKPKPTQDPNCVFTNTCQ